FQMDKFTLLIERHLGVRLGEDSNNVPGFKNEIICLLTVNRSSQIKGDQLSGELLRIKALNYRISPVDLCRRTLHAVLEFSFSDSGGLRLLLTGDLIAMLPMLAGDQKISVRNQVTDSHSLMPRIMPRNGHIAANRDGLVEFAGDVHKSHDVSIA